MRRDKLIAAVLLGGVILLTAGCGEKTDEKMKTFLVGEEGEEAYQTVSVEYDDVIKNAVISCKYTSTELENIAFPVGEQLIKQVHVKNGDFVNKGQLLAELDVEDLENVIAGLEYEVAHLEMELRHAEELKQFDLDTADIMYEGYTAHTEDDRKEWKEKRESIEDDYRQTLENLSDSLSISQKKLDKSRREWNQGRLFAGISGQITYIMNPLVDTYSVKDETIIKISNLDACYFVAEDMEYASYFSEDVPVTVVYKDAGEEYTCEAYPTDMDNWEKKM
ncbi:MAG: HlyD family secretion protein, partial [Acetatifactor sp.]|nr:HlyD family secretion protein [Acetatifactor sp.]